MVQPRSRGEGGGTSRSAKVAAKAVGTIADNNIIIEIGREEEEEDGEQDDQERRPDGYRHGRSRS